MNTRFRLLLAAGVIAIGQPMAALASGGAAAGAAAESTEAEVRKIDRDAGKVTLKHGAIRHLDMPPMTMAFPVRDRTMLDALQPGDKVRFRVSKDGGKHVVTDIVPSH